MGLDDIVVRIVAIAQEPNLADWMSGFGQMIAAIATIIIGLATWKVTAANPKIKLIMPRTIRLEFSEYYTTIYLQPSFIIENFTTRSDQIVNMKLIVHRKKSNDKREFVWRYIVKFGWSIPMQREVYVDRLSDAIALPVSFNSPQNPMAEFGYREEESLSPNNRTTNPEMEARRREFFLLGESYDFVLYAESASDQEVEATISLSLNTDDHADQYDELRQGRGPSVDENGQPVTVEYHEFEATVDKRKSIGRSRRL